MWYFHFVFFQAEDGIRDLTVTGVQTCALPISPTSGALNIGNFINVRNLQDDSNNYVGRFDWSPTNSDTVWVRYTNVHRFRFVPGTFGGILDGTSSSANGRLTMNGQGASIGWNHIFTPRLVNEFRIGWGRNWSRGVQDPFGLNTLAAFGFQGVPDSSLFWARKCILLNTSQCLIYYSVF